MNTSRSWDSVTDSVQETVRLGSDIGANLDGGEVIALKGTLGAGKTHLTKGVARGAGFEDARDVTSPTFVLVNEYSGRVPVLHIDAYRLKNSAELLGLGFDDMLDGRSTIIIEWADRVEDLLPDDRLEIELEITGPTSRRFQFTALGPRSSHLLNRIRNSSEHESGFS